MYIGEVEDELWQADLSLDDDVEPQSFTQDVVSILGFDPMEE